MGAKALADQEFALLDLIVRRPIEVEELAGRFSSRPLPELFSAAGAEFDFSYETLAPLIELLQSELDALPA